MSVLNPALSVGPQREQVLLSKYATHPEGVPWASTEAPVLPGLGLPLETSESGNTVGILSWLGLLLL